MATPERWMYRCTDCLAVSAIDGPLHYYTLHDSTGRPNGTLPGVRCECGGTAKSIGRVKSKRLMFDTRQVPCDSRCTNAPGPSCDCSCKGHNHGTHRLVDVEVDAGGIPRLRSPNVDRGHEWRMTIAMLWAAADRRAPIVAYRQGVRVASFELCRSIQAMILDAKNAKTWKGREAKVAAAFNFINGTTAAAA